MYGVLRILLLTILFASIIGCSSNSRKIDNTNDARSMDSDSRAQRYIIRSASVDIEVIDIKDSTKRVTELVSTNSGFVMSMSSRNETSTRISLKVPEQKLDGFIQSLVNVGKITSQYVSSEDVTEEIVDIEARIKNLYLLRDRYRELLKDAKNVTEVMSIEKELANIQSELDRIEGRRKLLMGQVEMSEVTISLKSRTVYGPLGYLSKGVFWVVKKLFVIK